MGFLSWITGTSKVNDVVDTGLDLVKKAASGIDELVYTDQEKAEASAASIAANMAHALEFAKITQSESGASAITRRVFGCIALGVFAIFALTALGATVLGSAALAVSIVNLASALKIGEIAMTVIVSTFGYYAWTRGKGSKK